MKLRRAIGLAAADASLIAAANATLSKRVEPLEPPLSGSHGMYRWCNMDVSYVEAGSEDDPTLVCLHGINAVGSSGEFRETFLTLAKSYYIVMPDLPGSGLSDCPALYYSLTLYGDFAGDFLTKYDDPAVLASSLAAVYTVAAAERDDVPTSRFVLVCPTSRSGPDPKERLRELVRAPVVGETLFNVVASQPSIRYFSANHGYYDLEKADEEWQEYERRTAHQEGARFAPTSFISGYPSTDIDLDGALATPDVPTTLVWGRGSNITPLKRNRDLAGAVDYTLVVFDGAMLLPHVGFLNTFVDIARNALD